MLSVHPRLPFSPKDARYLQTGGLCESPLCVLAFQDPFQHPKSGFPWYHGPQGDATPDDFVLRCNGDIAVKLRALSVRDNVVPETPESQDPLG